MGRWGLALALLGLAACRTPRPEGGPANALPVSELTAQFFETGQGQLSYRLEVAPAQLRAVDWQLALDGRAFAAGVDTPQPGGESTVLVRTPLTWRHLGWKDGPRYARLAVTGVAHLRDGGDRPFTARAEVLVAGAPVVDAPKE